MPSRVLTQTISGGSKLVARETTYTADQDQTNTFTIANAVTDGLVSIAFDAGAQLKLVYIVSDQNVTVEFNSIVGAGGTINLVAGVPYVWTTDIGTYFTNLITANVTATYWTNASGSTANIEFQYVADPTV